MMPILSSLVTALPPVAGNLTSGRLSVFNANQGKSREHYDCIRASIHQTDRLLTASTRQVSKPRDSGLDFSNGSEIWQAHRQQRCRDGCQISERYIITPLLATLRLHEILAVRRPSAQLIEALGYGTYSSYTLTQKVILSILIVVGGCQVSNRQP